MYDATDTHAIDIVVYLFKAGVLQNHSGQRGVRQRDRVSALTVQTPQDPVPAGVALA
jgi:hypothetical protein